MAEPEAEATPTVPAAAEGCPLAFLCIVCTLKKLLFPSVGVVFPPDLTIKLGELWTSCTGAGRGKYMQRGLQVWVFFCPMVVLVLLLLCGFFLCPCGHTFGKGVLRYRVYP